MAAQSFPGPSSSKPIWNYDMFLSFRGKDTRKNFTDHLYTALVKAGIHTFRDDEELRRGKEISCELLNAIEESRISIVVFSKGYASSSWCLDELVKIMECKNSIGQTVFPIFYDVDPSHVRHQTSSFADAFAHHEKRFNMEKMQKWRAALTQAANLSRDDLRNVANGYEAKFIQKFVEEVSNMVKPTFLNVDIHLIGIDSRVKEMKALLNVGRSDVRIVGIYGMGGIGKTTIAKAVYNEILYQFDGRSFLNIKDHLEDRNGLVHLQEQLLSDILQTKNLKIGNSDIGINIIKKKLCNKRVLIVLDDVDHLEQLYSLVGNCIWFGLGSKVIITTRDESLLTTKVGVNEKYRVEKLNHDESLQLFSWHAFNNSHPIEKYLKPSKHIVNYVGGLPLALKVLGSSCFDNESMKEWEETLEKLQKHPEKKIQDILRISFDSLDDTMKDIFLDIACFFIGMKKEYAIKILDGRGFFPYTGMRTLIKRSLVTIGSFNELRMHNLLRDMGRKIVCDSSPNNPGERTRLWFHEDVINVLKKQTGSEAVEGLVLFRNVDLKTEEFAKMKRLRLLQINDVNLSGCFEHLSQELIWLCWHKCPLTTYLPSNFHLDSLVVLDMQYRNVKQVWQGIKKLNKLELLDLSNSKYLTATPNFLEVPRLERLILKGCTNLVEVHHSIGHLKKLVFLDLKGCKNLRNLPSSICNLESLKTLDLSGYSKLDMLPEQFGNMRALRELLADRTAIKQLPSTFGLLKNLETLSLFGCKGQPSKSWLSSFSSWFSPRILKPINLLPTSFSGLCSLTKLRLSWCNLDAIPSDLGSLSSLKELELAGNNFRNLPHSISRLPKLSTLNLDDCTSLQSIPELPESLCFLHANKCTSLERLSNVSNLKKSPSFFLRMCHKLVEIQGFESMESISTTIHMEGCNNLAYNFRKSLIQGWSKSKLEIVIFPGSEIPNWFDHQRIGRSISFHVPSLSEGQIIRELFVWVICAADSWKQYVGSAGFIIKNKTTGREDTFIPLFYDIPSIPEDHSCVCCIRMYEVLMGSGEEMEVSLEQYTLLSLKFKKIGVHLVVDPPNVMDNHGSLIQYTSLSSCSNSDTATEGKMDTLCAKRGRDNNKAGPSYDWSNEEKCHKRSRMEPDAQEAKDSE